MIRQATIKDLDALAAFQQAMALETENHHLPLQQVRKGIEQLLLDKQRGIYYVVEENEEVQACTMTTYEWSDWRNAWVIWIQSVYVKPEHRRKGLFAGIYAHIQQLVKNNDAYSGIRLYVDHTNTSAIETYTRLGMSNEHYAMFEYMPKD